MSPNNGYEESCNSSGDESIQSWRSMIFSSGRSLSPGWSRSSSMTSGITATSSYDSRKKSKAKLGPISRPTPSELRSRSFDRNDGMQQRNSQVNSPSLVQVPLKSQKKSFLPIQSNIVKHTSNMHLHRCVTCSGPVYNSPLQLLAPSTMYYPQPVVPIPVAYGNYPMPMPYPLQMPVSVAPPMYRQPQLQYVSVQTHYTYTWTY